jgi:4-amino-4-deoxy-L-arabinose transferase-like glycosyltransferase
LFLCLGAAAFLIFARLGGPFLEPEEARYAEIPRQMLAQERFLVPVFDGQDYLDKPPLLYWSVMACYACFGVHVWSARLVPCLAAWLTVAVGYGWVRRGAGPRAALAAAAVLTLSADFVYRGPMLTMNGLLGLFVVAALAAGHLALTDPGRHRGWWVLSAACCGLGVLTKGPVAVALVVVPLAALLRSQTGIGWRGMKAMTGYLAVVGLVAGPWFLAVSLREPGFAEYFFWKHHVMRVAAPFDHAEPPWFYLPQLLAGFFPWSLVVVLIAWRSLRSEGRPTPASPEWLALIAAGCGFALFSLSGSKRPVYLVPVWPLFAVAVGIFLSHTLKAKGTLLGLTEKNWWRVGAAAFGVMAVGVVLWLPRYAERFSVPSEALTNLPEPAAGPRPVFCHPHLWPTVEFYRNGDEIRVFAKDELPQLLAALREYPEVLVVVRNGSETAELLRGLPPGMEFERRGQSGITTIGIVRRGRP